MSLFEEGRLAADLRDEHWISAALKSLGNEQIRRPFKSVARNLLRLRALHDQLEIVDLHPDGRSECINCGDNQWAVVSMKMRNGNMVAVAYCYRCGRQNGAISKKLVDPEHLPLLIDNTCSACGGSGCIECERRECHRCRSRRHLHVHHTAMRSIFGQEASTFPLVVLCRDCHSYLHATQEDYYRKKYAA